jgi:hypothetical protein
MSSGPQPEELIKRIPTLPADEAAMLGLGPDIDSGTREAQQLGRGLSAEAIKAESEENEHRRAEKFKDHFELISIVSLYGVFVLVLIVGFTWLFHLLTPDKWHYLTADQVSKLQNIVTGGILTGIATGHIKKRMGGA